MTLIAGVASAYRDPRAFGAEVTIGLDGEARNAIGRRLRSLVLPALALTLLLFFGTDAFSAQRTPLIAVPLLRVIAPHASVEQITLAHMLIRKLGHVIAYGTLALISFRALLAARHSSRQATWLALAICVTCSFLDEAHQVLVASRTASAVDVVIDASAAVLVLIAARIFVESRDSGGSSA